uniref:Stress response protein NST1-like n=1 Tax=Nicotiana tabacum TaxID=4097 RepID=A0A1S4ACL1_TOBAC|nr:PREDICTED: stress response protein NST1-like [Nicotiana tabacum]
MSSSFSQPASHSFMPSFEFTPSSSPSISRPDNGVDGNSTSPYTDSDTATQPPTQTSIRRQDPPNIGKYDDLRRLIIVPDGAGFYPSQATKVVVESMCSFYHAPWRFWSDVPSHIRDRMFAEFRMKCALSRDFKAEEKAKGRPVTHDEVFEETHMKKLKDGIKTTWIEPRAETTHDRDFWVAKITELYLQERAAREEKAKRREEEDRRREEEERRREEEMGRKDDALRLVTSDVKVSSLR